MKILSAIGVVVLFFLFVLITAVYSGYVFTYVWSWLIIPIFPVLPVLTIVQAIGFTFVVHMLVFQETESKAYNGEEPFEVILKGFVSGVVKISMFWLIAYIIHLYY